MTMPTIGQVVGRDVVVAIKVTPDGGVYVRFGRSTGIYVGPWILWKEYSR